MALLTQPTPKEHEALIRIANTPDGGLVLAYMERLADAYMRASCIPDSEAKSRQCQGAWDVVTSLCNEAKKQR